MGRWPRGRAVEVAAEALHGTLEERPKLRFVDLGEVLAGRAEQFDEHQSIVGPGRVVGDLVEDDLRGDGAGDRGNGALGPAACGGG